jgi:hypothetical protein
MAQAETRPARTSDRPPDRLVRHVFWKYPVIAVVAFAGLLILAAAVGSPNWPRDTIATVTKDDPGGAVLAFTQELHGTAASASNAQEWGMGDPGQVFVVTPLRQAAPWFGPGVCHRLGQADDACLDKGLATYQAATPDQQQQWAANYEKALGTITPAGGGDMGGMASPDYSKINTLQGDFGPVALLTGADLQLAQSGYLGQYLEAVEPGHSYHLTNIWLYDHPHLLNTAVDQGLTDDQWGMVKERGFSVGPWYLFIPAIFHVELPGGATGQGFVLWNLGFGAILLFAVPLVPGLRDLPRYLKLYRLIYRYPKPHELEQPAFRERHGATHGGEPAAEMPWIPGEA